jgi:ABC-type uncharacterized transport system substrate-binding protein
LTSADNASVGEFSSAGVDSGFAYRRRGDDSDPQAHPAQPLPPRVRYRFRQSQQNRREFIAGLGSTAAWPVVAVFAILARERPDALVVDGDAFFYGRRVQFATLAARERIPAAYSDRDHVAAGGLMSYGTDIADAFRQVGVYTGSILKGIKPADLPVVQSTRFQFVINLQTARLLGIEVPETLLTTADEVID